jgi:hypothetical protein
MSESTMSQESDLLLGYLNAQRRHVLGILEGLSEEDLRRPVLPSGWTCLGLVQQLALDVERFWFRRIVAAEPVDPAEPGHAAAEAACEVGPEVPADAVLDLYRREIELANAVVAATPLESPPASWPDFFGDWRLEDLREVLLHVITETAVHAATSTPYGSSSTAGAGSS